ncbi:hypothetical protein PG999_005341 [Apiospora kogelbergensis]|uniref:Transmembrane protein n=1 Tax=Apiospora kogelbergensis TaxID=1337665 RepID=A0AAW0R1W7_9PEZI
MLIATFAAVSSPFHLLGTQLPFFTNNAISLQDVAPYQQGSNSPTTAPAPTPQYAAAACGILLDKTFDQKTNRNTQDEEPQIPAFKVSDIVSTRRGRVVFYSAVAILATMESLTWLKFAPKAFSKKEEGQQ